MAARRGLKISEEKDPEVENYNNLITVEAEASGRPIRVAGTFMRRAPHIVLVNDYWVDVVPSGGYWLFSSHLDRPGLIGAVGTITGRSNINISSMQVSRLQPRGPALMVLGLDEPLDEAQRQDILAIADVYTVKVVRL